MGNEKELRIRDLIGISIISFIIVTVALIIAMVMYPVAVMLNEDLVVGIMGISTNVMIIVLLISKMQVSRDYVRGGIQDFRKKLKLREIIGVFVNIKVIGIGVMFLIIGLIISIDINMANEMYNYTSSEERFYTGSIAINAISIAIIAPIYEEIVFRKIIFKRLAKKVNITFGIILSSVLFGVLHAQDTMISAMFVGAAFCILYLKYNNILIPIFVHFFNNMIAVIALFAFKDESEEFIMLTQQDGIEFLSIGLIFAVIGLFYYIKFVRKNKEYLKPVETFAGS